MGEIEAPPQQPMLEIKGQMIQGDVNSEPSEHVELMLGDIQ
jgi:hypothetical protein